MLRSSLESFDLRVIPGSWICDLRHGSGHLDFVDGSLYEGAFAEDKFHGHGCYWDAETGIELTTTWREGLPANLTKSFSVQVVKSTNAEEGNNNSKQQQKTTINNNKQQQTTTTTNNNNKQQQQQQPKQKQPQKQQQKILSFYRNNLCQTILRNRK